MDKQLNADTGERDFHDIQNATTVVAQYLAVTAPVGATPAYIAERIMRSSLATGRRENISSDDLRNKTTQVASGLSRLVHGRWDQNACLKGLSSPSGTFLISADGDYELDNHAVAFVELPANSFVRSMFGPYAVLRFQPTNDAYAGRSWAFPTRESKGRTYLDPTMMPTALLEGIVRGFPDLETAEVALTELQQALRTLATARYRREQAEMSESERALAQHDADERRLEALASVPPREPEF